MGFEAHGIKNMKQTFKKLEEVPTEVAGSVLKSVVDEAVNILKKDAPKDTGSGAECAKIISFRSDGKTYFSYIYGFEGISWDIWKGILKKGTLYGDI